MSLFFFQAEDGIRDGTVTGVQTCALPILSSYFPLYLAAQSQQKLFDQGSNGQPRPNLSEAATSYLAGIEGRAEDLFYHTVAKIGRASCRERVKIWAAAVRWNIKKAKKGPR